MITNALQAWVLHKRWTGDTSAQVVFFTREQGILSCTCKGGRTPKKQSLLQAFTPLWLAVDERRDWHYLRQVEIISPSLQFTGSGLFSALYINELLHHALRPNDTNRLLYDVYERTLQTLTLLTDRLLIEATLRRFEWVLLTACGYQMSLTHDVHEMPIVASSQYTLIPGNGFSLVDKGILGAHILAFADDKLNDVEVLKAVKWIMRRAIDHALDGKPIKARELYGKRLLATV